MNKDIFEGKWEELKGKMRQQWGRLTDDDIEQIQGTHEEILGKLQKYYGYSREEAESAVKKFRDENLH
ncbi:MAG: CsbD family protein [Tatlockia sp.]|nr:CsbD family protein [Tatlockia sp.]